MAADPAPLRHALRRSGAAAAIWLAGSGVAVAFPLIDPSNQGTVPTGTELAAPDLQDLRHQLQLANGMTPTDRNTAIRRLARLLMEAAGVDPEEIGNDEC